MGRFREVLGVVGRYAEASRRAESYDVFGGVGGNWEALGEYVARQVGVLGGRFEVR